MMLLNMPEIVFNRWEKDYQSTTWEKMALNTTTASSKAWEPKHQDKDAKGPWKAVFTNSEESIALTQDVMLSQYYQKVNPKEASVYDCDQARPKKEYLDTLSLRARAFHGFLRPKIAQEFGEAGVNRAVDLFKDGSIDEDLDTLSTARTKPALFESLNLFSLATLRRLLEGKTARVGDAEIAAASSVEHQASYDTFTAKVLEEGADFKKKVEKIHGERQGCILKALKDAQAAHEKAVKLVEDQFFTNGLHVMKASDFPAAVNHIQQFVAECQKDATRKAELPKLSLWALNAGGAQMTVKKVAEWQKMVEAMSSSLTLFKGSHMLVYLEKTQGGQCEDLNWQVFSAFRDKGNDARRVLSFQHPIPHRNYKGSLTSTGRIVFVDNEKELQPQHLMSGSRILYGALSGTPLHAGVISYYVQSKNPAQNSGAQLGPKFPVPISGPK